ncbi:hypothetical protein HRH25_16790 [Flavisolibacter sp. BT320]|nr:hypothetical protein [Flavisolibacter longurius]
MEKNQQNQTGAALSGKASTEGARLGQQLPTENIGSLDKPQAENDKLEQHSESSLPESDEETLGTP